LFAGVLIFILYFNLLGVARTWVAKGESFAGVGLWWVHLVPLASVWLVDKWQQRNWFWK
jgi:lipopolysaccharide export system permease protein